MTASQTNLLGLLGSVHEARAAADGDTGDGGGAWADGFGIVAPDVARYCDVLGQVPPAQGTVARERARARQLALVDPATCAFVELLVASTDPQLVVEVGSGTGALTVHLMRALSADATLVTVEADPALQAATHDACSAQQLELQPGTTCAVEQRLGDARRALRDLRLASVEALVLTAPHSERLATLDWLAPFLAPGCLVIAPHALRGGRVADPLAATGAGGAGEPPEVHAQRVFNRCIAMDPRFRDVCLLPLGDGLLLARRSDAH